MLAGATLSGRVLDEAGRPAEGALVEARLAGKSGRPPVRATTDATGEFFLRVALGDYVVAAQTEKLVLPAPQTFRVRTDVAADACVLKLAPRHPLR